MEMEIDELAISLLALQHPVAADLRLTTAALEDQHRPGAHGRLGGEHRGARDLFDS